MDDPKNRPTEPENQEKKSQKNDFSQIDENKVFFLNKWCVWLCFKSD